MFLDINDAVTEITETIRQSLGPLADLKNANWLSYATDFCIQLVSTIILFIVIRVFFWKPITNILEKRREAIDKALDDANAAKENAIALQHDLEEELSSAKIKVKALLDQAEKDGNSRRDTIINDAKEEARRRLDNLEMELNQEKTKMEKAIRQEIVDIAFAAAEKIVSKEIDQNKYLDVVDDILKGAK